MKTLLFFTFLFIAKSTTAQIGFFNGLNTNQFQKINLSNALTGGLPFTTDDNLNIQGSPFLFDEFNDAFVQLRDDKFYSGIKIRFNLETNKIHYLNQDKKEMIADNGVIKRFYLKSFDGTDSIAYSYGCGYPESPGTTVYTFFQEYNSGVASFLRLHSKMIVERKTLATVDPAKQYDEKESYYVYNSNYKKLVKWKKGKDFILDMLADKSVEVGDYIRQNRMECKSPDDAIRIIQFYNQLFTK